MVCFNIITKNVFIKFFFSDIKENIKFLEKGVQLKETRFIVRVMRSLLSTRKRLTDQILKRVINHVYVHSQYQNDKEFLLSYIQVDAQVSFSVKYLEETTLLSLNSQWKLNQSMLQQRQQQ
jgi:hypothetical protein